MKTIKTAVTLFFAMSVCVLYSQNKHIVPPYYCGFEDATENALWDFNVGSGTACNDRWYIGSAAFNEGTHSLYISDNGGLDARYGAKPNITVVKRTFTIPDGGYEVSFDWCNLARQNSGLYVCLYSPTAINPDSDPISSSIPQWVQRTWRPVSMSDGTSTTCMSGTSSWTTSSFIFNVVGGRTMELAFVWVNSNRDTTIVDPISACIDNIQITSTDCRKPWNLQVDARCDSVLLSWEGISEEYMLEYKPNGTSLWRTVSNIREREYLLTGIPEGVYDFRVSGLCYNPVTDEMSYSAYATKNSQLVYCPENHCINYVDLTDESIVCYIGEAGNPASFKVGRVDFGPMDMLSRHTVNWTKDQYDPRTKNKLKTIPYGELASVRLGNWNKFGEAERIEFKYTVDSASAAILLMKYAIVFEDPDGHPEVDKPSFSLSVLTEDGMEIDPTCGNIHFYADRTRDGWHQEAGVNDGSVVMWKDWTTIGLNLSEYDGQTMSIRLEMGDCTWDGHFGYAYFTLGCTSGKIKNVSCGASPTTDIEAPLGFDYEWSSSEFPGMVLGTDRKFSVESSDTTTYYCKCMLKENHDCSFVLSTVVSPREAKAGYTYEWQPSSCQNKVRFRNLSHVTTLDESGNVVDTDEPCETTTWFFGGGDIRVENDPVYIFPPEGGTLDFSVKAEISGGECSDSITGTVTVPSIVTEPDTVIETICYGQSYNFAGKVLFRSDTVVDISQNIAGCDSITTLYLTVLPKIEDTQLDTTICYGDTLWVGKYPYFESQTVKVVRLNTVDGCDSVVVLNLTVLDEVTFTTTSIPEMDGPRSGSIFIENAPENYTWSVNGEQNGALTGLSGGIYTIIVYNSHGCASRPQEVFVDRECLDVEVESTEYIVCEDSFTVPFSVNSGFLSDYVIKYDQKALDAGFENDSTLFSPDAGLIELALPEPCRPNLYTATLTFKDAICEDVVFPLSIEVDYPDSVVAQKWNDVLAVKNSNHNGGYDFESFQWYRNGVAIPGATAPYLYLAEGEVFDISDQYHVILTRRDDGVSMPTCPITPIVRSDQKEYPTAMTVSRVGSKVLVSGVSEPSDVQVYDVSGRLWSSEKIYGGAAEIVMPSMPGVYMLVIENGVQVIQHKILVK